MISQMSAGVSATINTSDRGGELGIRKAAVCLGIIAGLLMMRGGAVFADDHGQKKSQTFDIDEESARRALERTLVQSGALLLKPGDAEVGFGFSYARDYSAAAGYFIQGGEAVLSMNDGRSSTASLSLQLKVGLPWDSQFELSAPYYYVEQSLLTRAGSSVVEGAKQYGQGMGDVAVAVAKTLLREENGSFGDLVLRFGWDSDSGEGADRGIRLSGSGYQEYTAALSLLKRQDPMVFSANVGHRRALKDVEAPWHVSSVSISLGMMLAASPETSLSFAVNQDILDGIEIDGEEVEGTDRVIGSFVVGASSIVGRRSFVNVSLSTGLTDDSPDYTFGISYSHRFVGLLAPGGR